MPVVTFEPSGVRITVEERTTLLQAVRLAKLKIMQNCGGLCSCGTCKLTVVDDASGLSSMGRQERKKLRKWVEP